MSILSAAFRSRLSPTHFVPETSDDLQAMVNAMQSARTRGMDVESNGLRYRDGRLPIAVGLGYLDHQGTPWCWYVPFRHATGERQFAPDVAKRAIGDALKDAPEVVMHGGKFDINMFRADGIPFPEDAAIHDTLPQGHLIYENRGLKLEKLIDDEKLSPWGSAFGATDEVQQWLGRRAKERKMRLKKDEWGEPSYLTMYGHSEIPIYLEAEYCCRDVAHALIHDWRMRAVAQGSLLPPAFQAARQALYQNEMLLTRALADMEWHGQAIDKDYVVAMAAQLDEDLEHRSAKVSKMFGATIRWHNDNDLRDYLYGALKLPKIELTKSGQPSVDRGTLLQLRGIRPELAPALEELGEYKVWQKVRSTYTLSLAQHAQADGRIHASFLQQGTVTGRLSSRSPNLQNIPTRHKEAGNAIRRAFVLEPGRARIYCDYSQIELRVLAWATGAKNLVSAYESPSYRAYLQGHLDYDQYRQHREHEEATDVHAAQAIATFGASPNDPDWKTKRRAAKIINFGVPYGMGWRGLNTNPELLLPEDEARSYYAVYHQKNPEIELAKKRLFATMTAKHPMPYFVNWAGRARHGPALNFKSEEARSDAERSLFASLIQGGAGELTRFSLVKLWWLQKSHGLPAGTITTSTVHDEIQVDCDVNDAKEVAMEVQRVMEDFPGRFGEIPVVADLEITTTSWADKRDYKPEAE